MPVKNLTDAFVRSALPLCGKDGKFKLTEYSDTKERGLCLRITPAGVKSWTYRFRLKSGEQKRLSIGRTADLSLASARDLVAEHRLKVNKGGDPVADKAMALNEAKASRTRESISDIGAWYYLECENGRHSPNARGPKRESTLRVEKPYFEKMIAPAIGKMKLADIPRHTVEEFINNLSDNQSPSAGRHCRVILHSIFEFAIWKEITERNPCRTLVKFKPAARERVLSDAELKTIWMALTPPIAIEGAPISAPVAYSILLAMVTLQRRGEVTGISLNELDLERRLWTIPSTRTKNHRTHIVPLSDLALELIDKALSVQARESQYIFPSPRNAEKPIDPQAMTRAFIRMRIALDMGDIRPHDMRRTGATALTSEVLGFQRFAVSKVLNHTSDTGGAAVVTGVYDRNEYLREKRRALDAWAAHLLTIFENRDANSNVINLARS